MDSFPLSLLARLLVNTGNFAVLLLCAAALLLLLSRPRAARILVLAVAIPALLIVVLPVNQWLARPLENRFSRPDWPPCVDGILVLGGGAVRAISATRNVPTYFTNEGTLVAATELARRYPKAKLVFTGGSFTGGSYPEAEVARAIFTQLGLDPERVVYEDRSRTTWENFLLSQRLIRPQPTDTWILVASATHMPRSMGIAQRLGWHMIPWPTDYRTMAGSASIFYFDFGRSLYEVDEAVHEWVGLVAYRLTGKTAAFFPAPATDAVPFACNVGNETPAAP